MEIRRIEQVKVAEKQQVSRSPKSEYALETVILNSGRTWSDVVYEGILVYRRLEIFDFSGFSGVSVYVAYKIRSVHEGVRFTLDAKFNNFLSQRTNDDALTYIDLLDQSYTCNCT